MTVLAFSRRSPLPPEGTLLVLYWANGVSLYSARGLKQTLDPIKASSVARRTINGALVDLSDAAFHKYQSEISCTDVEAPALDGVMPGMELIVDCVAELVCPTSATPSRTVVDSRTVGNYTVYRPRLTMMVRDYSQSLDEYARAVNWSLTLEEV
jgi:hypothetical protein